MRKIARCLATVLAVVIILGINTSSRADPLIFDYRGFHVDLSQVRGTMGDAKLIAAVKRQIDIVEEVKLKPQVVAFMRTVSVWANPKRTGKGPGHYSRKTGIDLQMDHDGPQIEKD